MNMLTFVLRSIRKYYNFCSFSMTFNFMNFKLAPYEGCGRRERPPIIKVNISLQK